MPYIHSVARALAPHAYTQEELSAALLKVWGRRYVNPERILRFQRNVLVGGRNLAVPVEQYEELSDLGTANDAWLAAAVPMATKATPAGTSAASKTLARCSSNRRVSAAQNAGPRRD